MTAHIPSFSPSHRLFVMRLSALALGCGIAQWSAGAYAQDYPSRPVRLVVASSIGSGVDLLARTVSDEFRGILNQSVVVDNRPGGGQNIAMDIVAKAAPDGYTLLLSTAALAANMSLYRKLPFDSVRDFAPITLVASTPFGLCTNPAVPAKSVKEFVQFVKNKPGALSYASAGSGSGSFLAAELFKIMAGLDVVHVAYNGGGPAMVAVVSGETQMFFAPLANCLNTVKQGRARILAVTSTRRMPSAPAVPTLAESGLPGYQFDNWYGLLAPAKTPPGVIRKLHEVMTSTLKKPEISRRLGELNYTSHGNQPEEFRDYLKAEIAKYADLVRRTGLAAN